MVVSVIAMQLCGMDPERSSNRSAETRTAGGWASGLNRLRETCEIPTDPLILRVAMPPKMARDPAGTDALALYCEALEAVR